MKKMKLMRIEPASAAKVSAMMMGVYVVVVGAVMLLLMLAFGIAGAMEGSSENLLFSAAMLVLLAVAIVMYIAVGAVLGFVMALAYNFMANKFGGLEFEFE